LALLGAYHGLNPGMGWLFAVGLGLQEGSRRAVLGALVPIAIGHELSVAVVVLVLGGLAATTPAAGVRALGAVGLVGFGAWKLLRPNRHPRWVGFRVSRPQLARWSFLMSSAHGAGLMLVPVLVGLPMAAAADDGPVHGSALLASGDGALPLMGAVAAVTVHSLAMLAVMGLGCGGRLPEGGAGDPAQGVGERGHDLGRRAGGRRGVHPLHLTPAVAATRS